MRSVFVLLLCFIACEGLAGAQAPPGPSLNIVVVDGEGAINNIVFGSAREPVVQVRDESDKPVAGARVTFTVPESGAGGTFLGGGKNLSVVTNEQGRAAGAGFRHNFVEGRFQIQVTATRGDRTGAVNITQTNVLPQKSVPSNDAGGTVQPRKKFGKGKVIAIVTAAVIIGAVAGSRGGGNDTTTTTTTPGTSITPGTVSVGTPR